jgi:hypothetical protein
VEGIERIQESRIRPPRLDSRVWRPFPLCLTRVPAYRRMSLTPGAEYVSSCRLPLRRRNSTAAKSRLSMARCLSNSALAKA